MSLPMTPRLTKHARERCAEMGVKTKRVKRMVRDPDIDRPSRDWEANREVSCRIAVRDDDPDIAAVYQPGEPPIVVTVVWRTDEVYTR